MELPVTLIYIFFLDKEIGSAVVNFRRAGKRSYSSTLSINTTGRYSI